MNDPIQLDPRRLLGVRILVDKSSADAAVQLGSKVGQKVGQKPRLTGSILSAKVGTKSGDKRQKPA